MRSIHFSLLCIALSLSVAAGTGGAAKAADWPEHAIELIVPSTAGGGTDLIARVAASMIELDKPVAIINRPGAGGTIATSEVAAAKPDGYTWLTVMPGPFVTQPYLIDLDYGLDDFRFLGVLNREPMFLVVPSKAPYANLKEFVEHAKNLKTSMKYASSSTGSIPHLVQAGFYKEAGINARHVPFNGSAEAIVALLGGEVSAQVAHMSEVHSYVASGDLKLLAVFSREPVAFAKDVPTVRSFGHDLYFDSYRFIAVPKNTPDEVCDVIREALRKATEKKEYREFLTKNYMEYESLTEEGCREVYKKIYDYFGGVVKAAGIGKK